MLNNNSLPQTPTNRNESIKFFNSLGFTFTLLGGQDGKRPIEHEWQNSLRTEAQARRHRGNVGVHAGKNSQNIIWLDLDADFVEFIATFPDFWDSLIVWRESENADRAKIAVKVVDRLPRSTNWKVKGEAHPRAELLSTGRQAAVIGIHESGVPYLHNSQSPIELTFGQLSAIWRKWTGQELPDPTAPRKHIDHNPNSTSSTPMEHDNTLRGRVRAFWSAYGVFEYHGMVNETNTEPNGDIRILGNGGLLAGNPDSENRWRWYCHSDGTGGDQFDAWAYCTDRTVNAETFPVILQEMAAAAGITDEPDNLDLIVNGQTVTLPVPDAMSFLISEYSNSDIYPLARDVAGRAMTARRRYDRTVMLAMLDKARVLGRIDGIKYSVRQMADDANMTAKAAAKTLRRLCEYGFWRRTQGASWYDGEICDDDDQHVVNMFEAAAFSLCGEVCRVTTDQTPVWLETAVDFVCSHSAQLDERTLRDYADHDAFGWGAKENATDEAHRLGRGCLDVVAALVMCNDQAYADLADSMGVSRSSASRYARNLEYFGLVETYKEGRITYVYLREDWREILDRVWLRLTTFGRNLKRRIDHLRQRIDRLQPFVGCVNSGRLGKSLYAMLRGLQRRLFALERQLHSLELLRMAA